MELQVEGIYTAEPRFEEKAKALKLKQEMAATAEEGRKRLRGMPGLDLVETPKRLERQIRTEVEARVPEAVRQTQTSKVFAKPEVYDRAVTPSSIAGLGEAASVARFRGAMANLEYNQNKLRRLADEPLTTTGGAALSPTLGNLDRWLDQPRQRERYETQRLVQRLMQKLPTLDYLSWADRGMPRPETYTKENLTDYVPRIEQLATYPGRPTKEMKREAREILKSTQAKGISGSVGELGNYTPYASAVESGDEALANERMRQFYKLDSVVQGKQNAISHGFMDGLGILPLEKAWMNVIGRPEGAKGFQNVETGMQKAAEMYPVLNQMAYFNGKTVQLAVLRKLVGAGVTALGGSGPIARVIQGMVTLGGTEAIQNLSDFVAGKMTPEQYWTSVEHGVRTGGVLAGLMELIPAAKRDFMDRFSQRKAGKGGSTALVPATSAPEPFGMEEELAEKEFDAYFEGGYNETEDYEEWERYVASLGNNAPQTFEDFRNIKYSEAWDDFQYYSNAIDTGDLSPLASFDLYQHKSNEIDQLLVGKVAANGIRITGKSKHCIVRLIGSVSQRRSGVNTFDMLDTICNPLRIDPVTYNSNGKSQRFIGRNAVVTINPDTGSIIQVNLPKMK